MMLTGAVVDGELLVAIVSGFYIGGFHTDGYHQQVLNMVPHIRNWINNPRVSVKDSLSIKY